MKLGHLFLAAALLLANCQPVYAQNVNSLINNGSSAGGSGGTPGGTNGQIQYNNAGAFGGVTNAGASNQISSGVTIDPRDPAFGSNTCTGYYGIATSTLGSGGTGYLIGDTFKIAAPTAGVLNTHANQATGHVTGVSGTTVTTYTIDTAGGAYNLVTGSTLSTTATSGSGSGLTITINTASSTGNDDTAAIEAAEAVAVLTGATVLPVNGCWINNLTTPQNTTIGLALNAPTYGYDVNNLPTWFIWGTPTFGINTTNSSNVSLYGFQVSGIASASAFGTTACIGGSSMGGGSGYFLGARNFAIGMAAHHCLVGLGTPTGGGSFILWTIINSDLSADNTAGAYGPFSDLVSLNNTYTSEGTGLWVSSSGGGFVRSIGDRIEYVNAYAIELDGNGALQSQIDDLQVDRAGYAGVYVNGARQVTMNGGAIRGSGFVGTLTVTNAANNGSGLIRLTVTGFGSNPNGGNSATSGLSTGDVINISGIVGTTEANGTWTITVIDGSHIDLQSSTYTNAYSSGGVGGVNGKSSFTNLYNATDFHATNVGYYGYSAGLDLSPAYLWQTQSFSHLSFRDGAAQLGNGNSGSYQIAMGNYIGGTPASMVIDIPGLPTFRNDQVCAATALVGTTPPTLTPNLLNGKQVCATLTHTATTTIAAPINGSDTQPLIIALTQDSTGSNLVTWNSAFDFGATGAPTLSTAAGKVDYLGFIYNSTLGYWVYQGQALGN